MLTLPDAIVPLLAPFATLFTSPTCRKAQLLVAGAILTPGQRTLRQKFILGVGSSAKRMNIRIDRAVLARLFPLRQRNNSE